MATYNPSPVDLAYGYAEKGQPYNAMNTPAETPQGQTEIIGADYAALMGNHSPFGRPITRFLHALLGLGVEYFAAMVLVLLVSGAASVAISDVAATPVTAGLFVGVSTAFSVGFIMYMSTAAGSGGHFNPAITLAVSLAYTLNPQKNGWKIMAIVKKLFLAIVIFIFYFAIQMLGGLTGGFFLHDINDGVVGRLGRPVFAAGLGWPDALLIEWFGSFIIVTVFLYTRFVHDTPNSPWINGMANGALAMATFAFTGSSFNPIRYLGAAFASGSYGDAWIYIIGPLLGAITAWFVFELDRFFFRGHLVYVGWQPFTYKTTWQSRSHVRVMYPPKDA